MASTTRRVLEGRVDYIVVIRKKGGVRPVAYAGQGTRAGPQRYGVAARLLRAYKQAMSGVERGEWNAGSTSVKNLMPHFADPNTIEVSLRVLVSAEIPTDPRSEAWVAAMDIIDLGEEIITDYCCTLANASHRGVTTFAGMVVDCPLMCERYLVAASPCQVP